MQTNWRRETARGKKRQKRKTEESSDVPEGKGERVNERGRKHMKNNFHRWSCGRASIASEPLHPGQPPMSTLCAGFERWGMLLGVNKRFCRAEGDEYRLCP